MIPFQYQLIIALRTCPRTLDVGAHGQLVGMGVDLREKQSIAGQASFEIKPGRGPNEPPEAAGVAVRQAVTL
jgi:hypothetical protein